MLTTLLSAVCALALSATNIPAQADTVDHYLIDGEFVANFDGSQLAGKTIVEYKIQTGYDHQDVVKVHNIITTDYKEPEPTIRIRSTQPGVEPVYVLDGKVISSDEFKNIKPSDIQSIEVIKQNTDELKQKYGDNAINGVLLITSKKGK